MQDIETQWRELKKKPQANKTDYLNKRKEIEKLYVEAKKGDNNKIKKEMLIRLLTYHKNFMKTDTQFNLSYLTKYLLEYYLIDKNSVNYKKYLDKWCACITLTPVEYNNVLKLTETAPSLLVFTLNIF